LIRRVWLPFTCDRGPSRAGDARIVTPVLTSTISTVGTVIPAAAPKGPEGPVPVCPGSVTVVVGAIWFPLVVTGCENRTNVLFPAAATAATGGAVAAAGIPPRPGSAAGLAYG